MLTFVLALAAGALAPWILNKALDEVGGRFGSFVSTKIKNPEKVFKKVLEEVCEKYKLNFEGIQRKIRANNLPVAKEELRRVLEEKLPEKHNEFLKEFLLKLMNRLSSRDKEGMIAGIWVEAGLDLEELKTTVAQRKDLQDLNASLEGYLKGLKEGQRRTHEYLNGITKQLDELLGTEFIEQLPYETRTISELLKEDKIKEADKRLNEILPKIRKTEDKRKEESKNIAVLYLQKGEIEFNFEKYDEAENWFSKSYGNALISKDTILISLCLGDIGASVGMQGRNEEALDIFTDVLILNPKFLTVYINRGIAYTELNQHEKAIEDFNKAIRLNPSFAWAYWYRSRVYLKISGYKEAAQDMKKAGILFWNARMRDVAIKVFSDCFNLREVEADVAAYCGLFLCLLKQPPIIVGLPFRSPEVNAVILVGMFGGMHMRDDSLKRILGLIVRKTQNKDISEEITALEREEEREDMKILLELLKSF